MMLLPVLFALVAQDPATPPAPCAAVDAVDASVLEIQRQPNRFLDRCVRVTGLFAGIRMYGDRDAIYRVQQFGPDGNFIPENLQHRIGIDNQDMRNLRLRRPVRTTVVGRVDDCERRAQRIVARGGIPFLGGYCHYENGPTIIVHEYRLHEGERYERLTGEAARRRLGNLAPIPADWPHRAALQRFADDFLQALRARDRTRMAELHDIRPDGRNDHDEQMLSALLTGETSPFAQLRDRSSPQIAMFATARDASPGLDADDDSIAGSICFCRTA